MSATLTLEHHHLLIGGTGRAGTSSLVRYLTAAGLDTTLARQGALAFWDDHANAGLEEMPVIDDPGSLPYVIKTPWLHEIIETFAADPTRRIDAVLVPVRSLREAAASRVIVELRSIYADAPWMAALDEPFSNWGTTAGGCLLPLEPIDQARLLATGFHQLIERLVQLDVPIVFLAFPRFAEDPDYLFQKLAPFLPGTGPAQARDLHARVADATKIRVGDELRSDQHPPGPAPLDGVPNLTALHNAALRRELTLSRSNLDTARAEAEAARTAATADEKATMTAQEEMREAHAKVAHHQAQIAELESTTVGLQTEIDGLKQALAAAEGEATRECELTVATAAALARSNTACNRERARADELAERCAKFVALLTATRASRSWRLTKPMRGVKVSLCKLKNSIAREWRRGNRR